MNNTREIARDVIQQVEDTTGRPVVVTEESSLDTMAVARMARGDAPAHVIAYSPRATGELDYLICFQCGFILRVFSTPPDQRFDLRGLPRGREIVETLLMASDGVAKRMNLRAEIVRGFRDRLFDGLMTQLRSVPVGLRVDLWLLDAHPELAPQQRASTLRQLTENLKTLGPDVRKIAPTKVFRASVTMNAAFASFWSTRWDDPSIVVPYQAAGFQKAGLGLLATFDERPRDPGADRTLIDAWATQLALTGWYDWVPFQSTPQ